MAEAQIPCTNFKLIDDLRAYLKCQSSAKYDSCKGLNAEVKTITGEHAVAHKLKLTDSQKKAVQELAHQPAELEKIIKQAASVDALMGIFANQGVIKAGHEGVAAEMKDQIGDFIKDNLKDTLLGKLHEAGTVKAGSVLTSHLSHTAASQMSHRLTDAVIKKAVERTLASGILLLDPAEGLNELSESVSGALLGRALSLAAGPIAVLISMTKPTACDEDDETSINSQVDGGECKPAYEINENVARFLVDEPENKQLELLKRPMVCAYYQKLHAKLFDQPKITSLTCRGESVVMKGKTPEGKALEVDLGFRGSLNTSSKVDGLLKQIYIREDGSVRSYPTVMGDGVIGNLQVSGQSAVEKTMLMKLYMPKVLDCCANKNDQDHSRCMAGYNTDSSGTEGGGSGNGDQGPTDSEH